MKITAEVVRKAAFLSRIKLKDEEEWDFTSQLDKILRYMEKLNTLDTSGVEPTSHAAPASNLTRKDEPRASLPAEKALENAPARHLNYFKVPRILEEEL